MKTKDKVLDIAMNLNRIGNWGADGYHMKQKRILIFLDQTTNILNTLNKAKLQDPFKKTFNRFLREFRRLEQEGKKGPKDELYWAEQMMTWGNILTHRAKLIDT